MIINTEIWNFLHRYTLFKTYWRCGNLKFMRKKIQRVITCLLYQLELPSERTLSSKMSQNHKDKYCILLSHETISITWINFHNKLPLIYVCMSVCNLLVLLLWRTLGNIGYLYGIDQIAKNRVYYDIIKIEKSGAYPGGREKWRMSVF